jgi:hypothetical protein
MIRCIFKVKFYCSNIENFIILCKFTLYMKFILNIILVWFVFFSLTIIPTYSLYSMQKNVCCKPTCEHTKSKSCCDGKSKNCLTSCSCLSNCYSSLELFSSSFYIQLPECIVVLLKNTFTNIGSIRNCLIDFFHPPEPIV